ncbi:MAG: 4Fe-4S dicluster domain-containing protein, partial [Candidatus Lokiarchaeota archaeon]|nr:4Fe-4S dicluster domain-containing protein [Candidatus Lokiarchaeota archaeon]
MKIKEEDKPYVEMIRAMNEGYPIKYPLSKKSLKLLKIVFKPEQAELLTYFQKPFFDQLNARQLSKRTNGKYTKQQVKELLDPLAEKGVVMKVFGAYALLPIVPGLFEFYYISSSDKKETLKEVAEIFDELAEEEGFLYELIASETPVFRTLPHSKPIEKTIEINEKMDTQQEILTFERAKEYLSMAHNWAVVPCACRTHAMIKDPTDICEKPFETCMAVGVGADWVLERGWGRKLSYEEALDLLIECEENGLVHTVMNNSQVPILICNCCICHCGILQTIKKTRNSRSCVISNFTPEIDQDKCKLCNKCVSLCPMDAIFHHYPRNEDLSDDYIVIIDEQCIGCGVCSTNCPTEAIKMVK